MRSPWSPKRYSLHYVYGEYEDRVDRVAWFDTLDEAIRFAHSGGIVWFDQEKYDDDEYEEHSWLYDEHDAYLFIRDEDARTYGKEYSARANGKGAGIPDPDYVGMYNRVMNESHPTSWGVESSWSA